jgi:hypothetical protein
MFIDTEIQCNNCIPSQHATKFPFVPVSPPKIPPSKSPIRVKSILPKTCNCTSTMPGTFGNRTPGVYATIDDVSVPIDCYSPVSIDTLLATPCRLPYGIFDYFSIPVSFDGAEDTRGQTDFVMELPDRSRRTIRNRSCGSSPALINILPAKSVVHSITPFDPDIQPSLSPKIISESPSPRISMVYNEYGELVDLEKLRIPLTPTEMTKTQILRIIGRAYHHEVGFPISFCVLGS